MMNKPTMTVFIGLPGSDVYNKATEYAQEDKLPIVDLVDGESIDMVKSLLSQGESVIVPSKLYSGTTRISYLTKFNDIECIKKCIVVASTYGNCLRHMTTKKELNDAYSRFFIPWTYEGWDEVHLIKSDEEIYSNNDLLFNDDYGLVHSNITIANEHDEEAKINAASLSMTYYQTAKKRGLNYKICKSLMFNYSGYSTKMKYDLDKINSPYDSLFCSQIEEMMDQELRIVNDSNSDDDLYIALLIQNQPIFNNYFYNDEYSNIEKIFGSKMCKDLYDRLQLINFVHEIAFTEI